MIRVTIRERTDRPNLQLAWTDPLSGRTLTKSAGSSDWSDAERAAARLELELQQIHGQARTGWDLFRIRLEDEHLDNLAPSTAKIYGYALNRFEQLMGKPIDINSINSSQLSRFSAKLREHDVTTETVRTTLRHVRGALGWAAKVGMIQTAPKIIMPRGTGSRGRALTIMEVCRYFATIRKLAPSYWPELSVLCKAIWLGGFRISEALKLSFDAGPVRVDLSREYPAVIWSVSGQKARREEVVPIAPDFARFLRRFEPSGPVAKTKLSRWAISDFLTDAGRTANIQVAPNKHATAQDLRRTFGRRWALRVHPLVLKTMMRHKTLETTLKYYVDIDSDSVARQIHAASVHPNVHEPNQIPSPPKQEHR